MDDSDDGMIPKMLSLLTHRFHVLRNGWSEETKNSVTSVPYGARLLYVGCPGYQKVESSKSKYGDRSECKTRTVVPWRCGWKSGVDITEYELHIMLQPGAATSF